MLETIRKFFEYNAWATPRVIASIESLTGDNRDALRPLAHMLTAEKVWLMRLNGEDTQSINLAPEFSLEECRELEAENSDGFARYFTRLSEEVLHSVLTYKNSKGAEFQTPVLDVLTHVAFHGAYHRGQVASAVRRLGGAPQNTDYITFEREL
jgi:uncharacterized damage-inducible protein DinB